MKRGSRKLTLDSTGSFAWDDPFSITELLTQGTPADVRQKLDHMASMLLGGNRLYPCESAWLAEKLFIIAKGGDANDALRVKGRKNAGFKTLYELRQLQYQVADLVAQGASQQKALGLIASYRLSEGRPNPPTQSECLAEIGRLKKLLSREK